MRVTVQIIGLDTVVLCPGRATDDREGFELLAADDVPKIKSSEEFGNGFDVREQASMRVEVNNGEGADGDGEVLERDGALDEVGRIPREMVRVRRGGVLR